jgi:hypothetical protein
MRADSVGSVGSLVLTADDGTHLGDTRQLERSWRRLSVAGVLGPGASEARVAVFPGPGDALGTGTLWVDDVSARVDGVERLANGDAESARALGGAVAAWLWRYADVQRLAGALPTALDDPRGTAAEAWRGVFFLYRSTFGGFGWLTIWPGPGYDLVAGALALFAVGAIATAALAPSWLADSTTTQGLLRTCGVGAALAAAAAIGGSMAGWGPDSLPQGRYLLSALVPIGVSAIALADRLAPRLGPWLLAGTAIALDAVLVWREIVPGFVGA